jgi:hypothetical protein
LDYRIFQLHASFKVCAQIFQLQASFDVCAHIPSTLLVSTSYIASMVTHDAILDTFVTIVMQDVGFHVGLEQLHALPSTTFNSSY